MKRRIWLLTVAAFVPYGVCLYDMGQDPVQAIPAILSLMTGCVLLLAASLLVVFADDGGSIMALVALACFFMTVRAVFLQSVMETAVTTVVAGLLYLLFLKVQPRVKVRDQ